MCSGLVNSSEEQQHLAGTLHSTLSGVTTLTHAAHRHSSLVAGVSGIVTVLAGYDECNHDDGQGHTVLCRARVGSCGRRAQPAAWVR